MCGKYFSYYVKNWICFFCENRISLNSSFLKKIVFIWKFDSYWSEIYEVYEFIQLTMIYIYILKQDTKEKMMI